MNPEDKKDEVIETEQPVTLTKAEADALGINLDKLTSQLSDARKSKDNMEKVERLVTEVAEAQKKFAEAMSEAVAKKRTEQEAAEFDQLVEEKMAEKYKSLDPQSVEAKEIFANLSKVYGEKNTGLALNASEFRKAIEAPIAKSDSEKGTKEELRKAYDYMYLLGTAWGGVKAGAKSDSVEINWNTMRDAAKELEKSGLAGAGLVIKGINEAMDTQTATEGLEWLPTNLSADLVDAIYLSLRVAPLFPRITMTSKTFELPQRTARARGYRMAEATANNQYFTNLATAHSMETAKMQFQAEKLATLNFISDELDQDAILPVLAMMREDVIWGLNTAIEDAVINGDTDTTTGHMDTTLWSGTADSRGAWDGIRKSIAAGQKTSLATFDLTGFRNVRKTLGKYSSPEIQSGDNLAWVVSPQTHIELLKLAEVVTVDKYGPNATVLTGEIGKLDGIPIIVSEYIYTNLNASGVYDGVTTTKTIALLIDRRGYAFGDRRLVRVESERQALAGQRFVLSTWRGDFQKIYPSSETFAALAYNITP